MYVEMDQIHFQYKNSDAWALDGFSLRLERGQCACILGPSGSGKSTVLRLIAGLEAPRRGRIAIDGKVVVDESTFVLPEKRRVGMVFQDFALFPHMTVTDNIGFGLFGLKKAEWRARVEEVLELTELKDLRSRYPHQLSGGQQQRVALARAIAPKPALLLMDEPFSTLDTELQHRIRADLKRIIEKTGMTTIIVSHDKEDALHLADLVVVIQNGAVVQKGSPRDVLAEAALLN